MTKTASSATADVGSVFNYELAYTLPSTGQSFTNVVIEDVLPPEVEFFQAVDTTDIAQTTYDAGTRTVRFVLNSPINSGVNGTLFIRVLFPDGTITGTQAVNSATMTGQLGGSAFPDVQAPPTVGVTVTATNGDNPGATAGGVQIRKTGTLPQASLGSGFAYDIRHGLGGDDAVTNYTITDTFPPEFVFQGWRHDRPFDGNTPLTFTVAYTTNASGSTFTDWPPIANPFTTDGNGGIQNVSRLSLPAGVYVTALRYTFTGPGAGGSIPSGTDYTFSTGARIRVIGDISTSRVNGTGNFEDIDGNDITGVTSFSNTAGLTADIVGGAALSESSTATTDIVADRAVYQLRKNLRRVGGASGPIVQGELLLVEISVLSNLTSTEDLVNPKVWDLLPPELEYVGPLNLTSVGTTPLPALPNFTATPDHAGTGRTLLAFEWDSSNPFTIPNTTEQEGVTLSFLVQVPFDTATDNYRNEVFGTVENPHVCFQPNFEEADQLDFDGDMDTAEIFCGGRPANFRVERDLNAAGLASQKWVKGECDTEFSRFPSFGSTVPGGAADYELRISNPNAATVSDIRVIDILPFVGDTGVVDLGPRSSEWRPVLAGPVIPPAAATLPSGITNIDISYSTSSNPNRGDIGLSNVGESSTTWTSTPPSDITTVRSLRFIITGTLAQSEEIIFGWPMRAPLDAPTNGEIAWNSFGFTADVVGGSTLPASEPVKVGFTTKPGSPAQYGNFVWLDANRDGIQDGNEPGINGVRVELYQSSVVDPSVVDPFRFTVTQNDGTSDGAYLFTDLPADDYYAVFTAPDGFSASPTDAGTNDAADSDGTQIPTTTLYRTATTTLGATETDFTWDQGFFDPNNGITIGDFVWSDVNNNGVQDDGEPGLENVAVKLIQGGNTIGTTTTDSNGLYVFGGPTDLNLNTSTNTTTGSVDVSINASSDDASQRATPSQLDDMDLDLGQRDQGNTATNAQAVGLRFNNITIPQGATITSSFIRFTSNNVSAPPNVTNQLNGGAGPPAVDLTISVEDSDDPVTFGNGAAGPGARTKVSGLDVSWVPATWTAANTEFDTVSINTLVQNIVSRPGWNSGQSMVFIIEGTGQREAESFDGNNANAPQLLIEWSLDEQVQNSIETNTAYTVCIDPAQAALSGLSLSPDNQGDDALDSDATLSGGDAVISYNTTGVSGGTFDDTLDFGFSGGTLPCDISITTLNVSNVDQGAGTMDVSITINYTNLPTQTANVVIDGVTTQVSLTGAVNSTGSEVVTLSGVGVSDTVRVFLDGFSGDSDKDVTDNTSLASRIPSVTQIAGKVFRDSDVQNGLIDPSETQRVQGVTVTAYDNAGAQAGQIISDSDGCYTVDLTTAGTYRLEFTTIPDGLNPSPVANGSTTRFAQTGTTEDLALLNLTDTCDENPFVFTPCYINGGLTNANAANQEALVGFRYDDSGTSTANKVVLATHSQVGSTWGAAYDAKRNLFYASAVTRRHVPMGPGGPGAIYSIDNSTGTPQLSTLITLPTADVNPGNLLADNATRGIPDAQDPGLQSADATGFDGVGKTAFGDIDISADQDTLYAIALGSKTLQAIDLTQNTPSAVSLDIWNATAALQTGPSSCPEANFRPWAIEIDGNDIFVGAVCDTTLRAYILRLVPGGAAGIAGDTFSIEFDYLIPQTGKEPAWDRPIPPYNNSNAPGFSSAQETAILNDSQWRPWISTWPATTVTFFGSENYVINAQPILSDLERLEDGSFVIGYNDRMAMQGGFLNNNPSGTGAFVTIGAGDINLATFAGGSYTVDSLASEFFTGEEWLQTALGLNYTEHAETAFGSLALRPGESEIMTTVFDPIDGNFNAGGTKRMSVSTGAEVAGSQFQLYGSGSAGTTFAKAAGLGDLEIACTTPIRIGDLVFEDVNQNGQQDVGEPGIDGVVIQIFDLAGNQVGSDITTADGGLWLSPELLSNTSYYVVLADSNFDLNQPLENFQATLPDSATTTDNLDSDLVSLSVPSLPFNGDPGVIATTASTSDFDFDFGLIDASGLPGVGNLVWIEDATSENGVYNSGVDTAAQGVTVQLFAVGQTPGVDSPAGSDLTDANGCYEIRVPAGDYFVFIPASNFSSGSLAGTVSIAGYGADDAVDDGPTGPGDNGVDVIDPSASGIRSLSFTLAVGDEPADADETGKDGMGDSLDLNLDYTIDFGFISSTSALPKITDADNAGVGTIAIPGNGEGAGELVRTITVAESCLVTDVNIGIRVSTPFNNNGSDDRSVVNMFLTSPAGTTVALYDGAGAFAGGRRHINVLFDDGGAVTYASQAQAVETWSLTAPFSDRTYQPEGSLSAFNGENAQGDWILRFTRDDGGFFDNEYQEAELCITCVASEPKVGVGNLVFIDNGGTNNVYDLGTDTPVEGVKVELLDSGNQVVASAVTDTDGCYSIVTDPGTGYTLRIPSSEFQVDAPLEGVFASLTDGTGTTDDDDNGVGTGNLASLQTSGVTSAAFDLSDGGAPTGETGKGNTIDDADDDNFDLTRDFGFSTDSACTLTNLVTSATNYDAANGGTMDLTVTFDYTGAAAEQAFEILVGTTVVGTGSLASGDPADGNTSFTLTGVAIGTDVGVRFTGSTDSAKTDTGNLVTPEVGIGNYVWHDEDNNGIADPGENPIHVDMAAGDSPIQITLYLDRDGDGVQEPAGDDAPAIATSTITAQANGGTDSNYEFTGLIPGTYYVQLTDLPDAIGLSSTTIDGNDDSVNNDDNGLQPDGPGTAVTSRMISLQAGEETADDGSTDGNIDGTVDFGLVDPTIGNLVWFDRNNNGMVDEGEPGIPNVVVNLYDATDLSTIVLTTTTDGDGEYYFANLQLGQGYVVEIPTSNFAAGGALEAFPSSSDGVQGDIQVDEDDNGDQPSGSGTVIRSQPITLTAGDEPIDAGAETGRGADKDNLDDNNSDLTIDFGVFRCSLTLANIVASNVDFVANTMDLALNISFVNSLTATGSTQTVTFDIGGQTFDRTVPATTSGVQSVTFSGVPADTTIEAYFAGQQSNPEKSTVAAVSLGAPLAAPENKIPPALQTTTTGATYLFLPCFVRGEANEDVDTLVRFPLDHAALSNGSGAAGTDGAAFNVANNPDPEHLATKADTGAIYGTAYDSETDSLFMSAFTKVQAEHGPGGPAAIYVQRGVTTTGMPSPPTLYLDLNTISTTDSLDLRDPAGGTFDTDNDFNTVPLVGKNSFGDIDLSVDGTTLYTISLADRRLYSIPTSGPLNATTVTSVAIPTAGPAGNADFGIGAGYAAADIRPFGLGIDGTGKVYVGAVHSAETSGVRSDLRGIIWCYDGTNFELLLSFPLDYDRLAPSLTFNPWNGEGPDAELNGGTLQARASGTEIARRSEPLLSDITFDGRGMILAFHDRWTDKGPATGNPALLPGGARSSGDTLRAFVSASGLWTIENDGAAGPLVSSAGAASAQGPGGGEFFFQDRLGDNTSEAGLGSVLYLSDRDELIVTATDAAAFTTSGTVATAASGQIFNNFNAAGIQRYAPTSGHHLGAYDVYDNSMVADTFSKGGGVGDVEVGSRMLAQGAQFACLGNTIWADTDVDGIYEPGDGEEGVDGITVSLCDTAGDPVPNPNLPGNPAYTVVTGDNPGTTDVVEKGWYFFTNLPPGDYQVKFTPPSALPLLTGGTPGSDDRVNNDNNGTQTGGTGTQITTTTNINLIAGEIDDTVDFGLTVDVPCSVDIAGVNRSAVDLTAGTSTFTVDVDYEGAPETSVGVSEITFVIGGQTFTRNITSGPRTTGSETFTITGVPLSATDVQVYFTGSLGDADKDDTATIAFDTESFTCNEYIYLNEVSNGGAVHKYLVSTDGTLTEIGSPWNNTVGTAPHGLGFDLNGKLYIASLRTGPVRQLNCTGEVTSGYQIDFPIENPPSSPFSAFNFGSIGNTLFVNNGSVSSGVAGINGFDTCTQTQTIASNLIADPTNSTSIAWGYHIDPRTQTMYATRRNGNVYIFDQSDLGTTAVPTNLNVTFNIPSPGGLGINGITTDADGNIYIANSGNGSSTLRKYDSLGNLLGESAADLGDTGVNAGGYFNILGLVYSETADRIYASNFTFTDDCVSEFDRDLNYIGAAVPATNAGNVQGKAIAIMTECCPPEFTVLERTVCWTGTPKTVFLQDILNAPGLVCEGEWAETANTSGGNIVLDPCALSLTITGTGCATYTLASDGTAPNNQCGPFEIVINFCSTDCDFGDLPDQVADNRASFDYSTTEANGGAAHGIVAGLQMGATVDADNGTLQNATATADNTDGSNDEDGVTFPATITPGANATVVVSATNDVVGGDDATLCGYIDWNQDGDFQDPGESASIIVPNSASGSNDYNLVFAVPADADVSNAVAARFRLSTEECQSNGIAKDGEVEDYILTSFIGDFVWNDLDGDGIQDAGEPGIDGVVLTLHNSDGSPVECAEFLSSVADDFTPGVAYSENEGTAWPADWTESDASSASPTSLGAVQIVNDTTTGGNGRALRLEGLDTGADVSSASRAIDLTGCDEATLGLSYRFVNLDAGDALSVTFLDSGNSVIASGTFTDAVATGVTDQVDDSYRSALIDVPTNATSFVIQGNAGVDSGEFIYINFVEFTCLENQPVSTTTAGGGLYRFDQSDCLIPGNNYQVRIDNTQASLSGLSLTGQNAGGVTSNDPVNDNSDSDAEDSTVPGTSIISLTAPALGQENTGYDFGFGAFYDYGDLPEQAGSKDYPTNGTATIDRPRHLLGTGLALGSTVDSESDGQASAQANGDGADEDGFANLPDLVPGETYTIPFTVSNTSATGPFYLNAWIDFNCNGDLTEAADRIAGGTGGDATVVTVGANTLTFTVPANATPGTTFARFRLSTTQELAPTGDAGDGEVEDYLLRIVNELGAIGNYVWVDENSDGLQDAGEPGIPNVKVDLKQGGATIASTYTDANGGYLFPDLPAGDYTVDVDESTLPTGYTQTTIFTNGTGDFGNKDHSGNGYAITLGQGEINLTADFGYNANPTADVNGGTNTAALGDRVWIDADQDGVQDPEEIGVSGVTLTLMGAGPDNELGTADDTNLGTTTTDSNGNYLFDGLAPGAYMVTVTDTADVLNGYTQTGDPDHFAVTDTSAGNNDNKSTLPVVLGPGDVFLNVDFGYDNDTVLSTIGDRVWLDENGDGDSADADKNAVDPEPGIAGVTVALIDDVNNDGVWDPDGVDNIAGNTDDEVILGTDITDADGCYLFTGVPNGNYLVSVTDTDGVLTGLDPTYDNDGGTIGTSEVDITTGGTTVTNQDFAYSATAPRGSIGDTVWADLDGSGIVDDPNGDQSTQGAEPGIPGVTVTLSQGGTIIATTVTDSNGNYLFDDLPLGSYTVTVDTTAVGAAGYLTTPSYDPDGGADNTSDVTITVTDPHDRDQDFSYPPGATTLGSVGDKVWLDATNDATVNGDATQAAGENGIAGVTVTLTPPTGVDAGEGSNVPVTTVTDANGCYLFTDLPLSPNPYTVSITPPAGFQADYDSDVPGDNQSTVVVNTGTEHPRTEDFSLEPTTAATQLYSLGNTIWLDADADSDRTEDPGNDGSAATRENPLAGVRVDLLDSAGNVLATDTTDSLGQYLFNNLAPADYMVRVDTGTLPDGVSPVSTYESDATNGGGNGKTTVTISNADILDQDFSFPPSGAIGDRVFFDAGTSGTQDENDGGIPDVTVKLIQGGTEIARTTTDANGNYLFDDLPFGDYTVMVDTATLPPGLSNSVDPDGGADSMSVVTISSTTPVDLDQDFGYNGGPGAIGTLVWEDHDADATFDAAATGDAAEPLFNMVTVDLYRDTNNNGVRDANESRLARTTTAASDLANTIDTGNYRFEGLPVATTGDTNYIVHVSDEKGVLNGYWHSLSTDQAQATNNVSKEDEYLVTLTNAAPVNENADFGYYKDLAAVGNYVWVDTNDNGIQDTSESGIAGATLTLTVTYPDTTVVTLVTTTDANGFYSFPNLLTDEDYNCGNVANADSTQPVFTIAVDAPSGFVLSTNTDVVSAGDQADADASGVEAKPTQGITNLTASALPTSEPVAASYDFAVVPVPTKSDTFGGFIADNAEALNVDDNTGGAAGQTPANDPFSGNANAGVTDTNGDDAAALTGMGSDADGDGFSNLLEYALCYKPDTGLKVFPDGTTANGGFMIAPNGQNLDISYTGPTGAADLAYTLQQSTDGQNWTDVTGSITPITSTGPVTGTTTTTFPSVNSLAPDGPLLFRLKIDALDVNNGNAVVATDIPQILGYNDHCIRPICETFSDPFLSKCDFTGTISSVSGGDIVFNGETALNASLTASNYYIEVLSGANAGQRFDIESVGTDRLTLAADSDICSITAPHSTVAVTAGAAPTSLVDDEIVLRQHRTIGDVFMTDAFVAGTNAMNSARLLVLDPSSQNFTTYNLIITDDMGDADPSNDTVEWQDGNGVSVMNNTVHPGQGYFTHNEGGPVIGSPTESCVLQYGEVRTTAINVPMKNNYNFVSSLYPIAQTADGMESDGMGGMQPTSNSRQMTQSNTSATYNGSPARSRADQVQLWADDTNTDGVPTVWYKAYFYAVAPGGIDQWTLNEDPTIANQGANIVFDPDRSAIICVSDGDRPSNVIPSPIAPTNGL